MVQFSLPAISNVRQRKARKISGTKSTTGNCSICGIGKLRGGRATVTLERGGSVVVIRGVPARICPACGEYYLTPVVTDRVMKRAERAIADGAEVGIIKYAA